MLSALTVFALGAFLPFRGRPPRPFAGPRLTLDGRPKVLARDGGGGGERGGDGGESTVTSSGEEVSAIGLVFGRRIGGDDEDDEDDCHRDGVGRATLVAGVTRSTAGGVAGVIMSTVGGVAGVTRSIVVSRLGRFLASGNELCRRFLIFLAASGRGVSFRLSGRPAWPFAGPCLRLGGRPEVFAGGGGGVRDGARGDGGGESTLASSGVAGNGLLFERRIGSDDDATAVSLWASDLWIRVGAR